MRSAWSSALSCVIPGISWHIPETPNIKNLSKRHSISSEVLDNVLWKMGFCNKSSCKPATHSNKISKLTENYVATLTPEAEDWIEWFGWTPPPSNSVICWKWKVNIPILSIGTNFCMQKLIGSSERTLTSHLCHFVCIRQGLRIQWFYLW